MENTTLTFMGRTLSEEYRPISFIVNQCQRFMEAEHISKEYMGGFMMAVLENDFMQAVGRADDAKNLKLIATFLNCQAGCVRDKYSTL